MEIDAKKDKESVEDLNARPYQDVLAEEAFKANKILYLPTGSGKTFIAIMVLKRLFPLLQIDFSKGGKRAVFLVNTVALVEQQASVLERHLPLDKVGQYSGEMNLDFWEKEKWQMEFNTYQVMVMTSEILHQLLLKRYIQVSDLALLILDECHHAVEDHPMRQIMRLFEDCPKDKLPRVVGLTATLLNSTPKHLHKVKEEVKKLEVTLHSCVATTNSWDIVKQFSTKPNESHAIYTEDSNFSIQDSYIFSKIEAASLLCKSYNFHHEFSSGTGNIYVEGFVPLLSGKKFDVGNLISQVTKQLGWLGMYGCSKTLVAVYVTLKLIEQTWVHKKIHIMINYLTCLLLLISRYLELRMESNLSESMKALRNSSPKVNCLVALLERHHNVCKSNPEGEPMQALIFVEEKMTAKVLCSVLKNIANKSKFSFIQTGFIVGGSYNPLSETWEGAYRKSMNEKVLERFRLREINVLVSTDILEEGIDIPDCNLVVRFDEAKSYRSYVQSKGRARHSTSFFVLMTSRVNKERYLERIEYFKLVEAELEEMLVGQTDWRQSPSEEELEKLYCSELEPYYTSIGAKVTLVSAIQLLNGYCMFLAHDRFCKVSLIWHQDKSRTPTVAIQLPKLSPLQELVKGKPMASLKLARRAAALEACKRLHEIGELDDNLMPNEKCLGEEDLKALLPLWEDEETQANEHKTGTAKKLRSYRIYKPKCFQDCIPYAHNQQVYVHVLEMTLTATKPDDLGKRDTGSCLEDKKSFAIVSSKLLPEICQFPVFSKFGTLNIKLIPNLRKPITLTEDELKKIQCFHFYLFSSMIPTARRYLVFSKDSYLIAPTKYIDGHGNYELDWNFMEACFVEPKIDLPLKCIVTPVHRGVVIPHEAYFVTRICHELNAYSSFPDKSYTDYKTYFEQKYNFILEHPELPLLEVEPFQVLSNCLLPRLNTSTTKSVIYFPLEACKIKCAEGCFFLKAVVLPSVLHRLERFLLAEELLREISPSINIEVDSAHYGSDCCEWKKAQELYVNSSTTSSKAKDLLKTCTFPQPTKQLVKQWGGHEEPVDIEQNFETATDLDIQAYANFISHKYSPSEQLIHKAPTKSWELPALEVGESVIQLLSDSGVGPHPCNIMEALTAASADDLWNLERLETLGDSFLKFAVSLMLFDRLPELSEGKLTQIKGQILGNRNLFYCAKKRSFAHFMKIRKVNPQENWIPPSFSIPKEVVLEGLVPMILQLELSTTEQFNNFVKDSSLDHIKKKRDLTIFAETEYSNSLNFLKDQQSISDKAVADSVESLIGAYLQKSGPKGALKFMEWMKVLPTGSHIQTPSVLKPSNNFDFSVDLKVARCIGYKFNNKLLLSEALTHASSPSASSSYERLEFLGDAVLDFLITAYIFEKCGNLNPGELTDLRSALVNNITFACLTVRYGLHKYINAASPSLLDAMNRFIVFQEKRDHVIDEEVLILLEEKECSIAETLDVPKALGDIFEAVIGAVYLDCDRNLDVVWRVIYRLMKTEIYSFGRNIPKQVVRQLYETVGQTGVSFRSSDAPKTLQIIQNQVVLEMFVNGELKSFDGFGPNKAAAKKSAAKLGLRYLKSLKCKSLSE